jgi:superfamily II DNA or RNA helicase
MIEIKFEKNQAQLTCDFLDEIREHFSVKNEAASFMRKYGRFIPQRTYAITPTGKFEPCLFFEIQKYLINRQYTGEIKFGDEFKHECTPAPTRWLDLPNFKLDPYPLSLQLRDYQEEITRTCLNRGRGTVVLATAGGKTLTMASVLSNIWAANNKFKCIIIVPDLGLVEQTFNDFSSYKVPFSVCRWTGSHSIDNDTINSTNVIVANLGILQSKNSDLTWIENVDVVVVDEVHKIRRGNEINKLFKKIKTPVRFGFTGTMPEGPLDQWNIIGKIGPIIYEKSSYELRLENYVSNVSVQIVRISYNRDPFRDAIHDVSATDRYRAEQSFLISNTFRNNFLAKLSCGLNKNALILIDYIEHGENIYNAVKTTCPNKHVYFIRGEVEIDEREKVKKLMEERDDVVVVAISKIFSTGINIKNLHYIIFAGGGKAKIKIVQSIGRGLRLHKDKDKLIIVDIADNLKYGQSHMDKRIKLYEKENINFAIKEIKES